MKKISSDVAYDYIRQRILDGSFAPGTLLTANLLSTEIGVSRTPVRDALRQLEANGLVVIQAHLGASVKKVDLEEYRDICLMRMALESFAAGMAARYRTDLDLQEMGSALASMRRLTQEILSAESEKESLPALVQQDIRFHLAIISAAKSKLIRKEILRLHLINRVVSGTSGVKSIINKQEIDTYRRQALVSHEEIYKAIAVHDQMGARNAMEHHIQEIIDSELESISQKEGSQPPNLPNHEQLIYIT